MWNPATGGVSGLVRLRSVHTTEERVENPHHASGGGIFVERDSRSSAPQRGAIIPPFQSANFFQGRSLLLIQKRVAPWGAGPRNAHLYKYATPLGWRGFFSQLLQLWVFRHTLFRIDSAVPLKIFSFS
jgi:hypothetical protein